MSFHPVNYPWVEKGITPSDKPVMYWHDATQTWEVWVNMKCVALCEDNLPNLEVWWDFVQKTYFGASDKPF